ncbi:MAG: hypothetical protein IT456_06100 [Planctomycetes bacterium]|nr:hypothetical protein [Planctomycetota bacterium]
MSTRQLLPFSALFFLATCLLPSCASVPVAAADAGAKAPAAESKSDAAGKAEARKGKQKELNKKIRELAHARIEKETGAIDAKIRAGAVAAALQNATDELAEKQKALELFLGEQRSRELEEKKISLDRSAQRAEFAKDELGELVSMYENDEFAKTTKELVLKRGRRELEMADRSLAVERREFAEFEQHALPQRERELRRKVADAELERKKAEFEVDKAKLELALAAAKADESIAELEAEIVELREALAKEPS